MQGFIDKSYYVYCQNREEVLAFHALCQKYAIPYTNRWNAECEIEEYVDEATFVMDFDDIDGDGVSFWSDDEGGDGERPCIRFSDIDERLNPPDIDPDDFMSIL